MGDSASSRRQQVLQLWLDSAALDTAVVAWAFHDGADGAGAPMPEDRPPYSTGLDALRDGWFLLQAPGPLGDGSSPAGVGAEFVFTRTVHSP